MTTSYTGMNRNNGESLSDISHLRQSVRDILITPQGSRVMRRQYGSLLSTLIDQPQSPAVKLQVQAACYMALLQWEPRLKLTAITLESYYDGQLVVDITGAYTDTGDTLSLTVPVS
ncbi:GPW/gp25 family protein [Pectobacteriaceae bacterium CE70]|nr:MULTISPECIES: GPW/gp25 family protein [Enterobacterales]WJV60056.1 GPW/gp25 family protein [Pectobacteriaceae bacterium C111]WJV64393.1 GPW/gp25 family protein [Pectobacteriaceae bacterium C52]WJV65175.1 GPW/gp25 family protein [Pectobacteriaceae bacterium CE70]WJY09189.1 GPW/gp25 family protein [Pectobacteriaceae bacterium C80]WJY13239.1 GPW/gp25 family protein [Pectobacteriaceae bacterium CE90]